MQIAAICNGYVAANAEDELESLAKRLRELVNDKNHKVLQFVPYIPPETQILGPSLNSILIRAIFERTDEAVLQNCKYSQHRS